MSQLTTNSKYNDSKAAIEARAIKNQNEADIKQFYIDCLAVAKLDYNKHIAFLVTNPNLQQIEKYKYRECTTDIEKDILDQIIIDYKIDKNQINIENTNQEDFDLNSPFVSNSIGCSVKLKDDYVFINKGNFFKALNFFDTDANNVKIPLETITVINYKESGILDGYLEFVYQGFIPRNNDTVKHAQENVITFRGEKNNLLFKSFKEIVEKRIRQINNKSEISTSFSLADEIQKLADLKNKGILTEDEFQLQKRKIINS